ncbi:MAG: ACT domain-containing protein [Oscillospiraceae bacterium]|nr:ACT domain-containing protein [Oscillospiraceae bacterium]
MRAIVTVIGKDRVGIIAEVCALLAKNNINVLDISQTILQDYFTMIMMVDTAACDMPFAQMVQYLQEEGRKIGLNVHAQREDIFNAMHRI